MNNLQIFNSEQFGAIRCMSLDGQPWFCLSDLCQALEISNTSNVKTRLISDGIRTMEAVDTRGRPNTMIFVNEPNMYKTIFQSRKKEAESFTNWVTADILPSIRRTGSYSLPASTPTTSPGGVASLINVFRRVMREQGSSPTEICLMARNIGLAYGVPLPDKFVKELPGQLPGQLTF